MKMPRSHSENENIQYVQELAEVDGPFESPICINFRDLTKLELPSLVWNRSETSPKKMKLTNTGHTVIISAKWKCERPFLTGGPLLGKYVFSQIHFHWGQDDCKGSEHLVCGEGFPLEMHVAHFKTEYVTQESALKEKDGMVVVVYLFKLQDEPNTNLKKIINTLPSIKQANTSSPLEPRPIMSLLNTFSDDYFMYWGSVVTSTCAHILLWIVCREPFGISREQVNEFRKICDSSQQPIYRNSRESQPLHKRNVFHVNASKNIDSPMLPIKKMVGCYCKKSGENLNLPLQLNDCSCQGYSRNQEEIEGKQPMETNIPRNFFVHRSFVQRTTVQSVPLLPKRFESVDIGQLCCLNSMAEKREDHKGKLVSQSCCFFSMKDFNKMKGRNDNRIARDRKKPFNSIKALSHIMDSLEALKSHTLKKLKEIESINQEIKGMKSVCQDSEGRRWLRKIEKLMSRQRRFTIRTSHSCFSELKKLARECNFDKFFENKVVSVGDNANKMTRRNSSEVIERALPCSDVCMNDAGDKTPPKFFSIGKAAMFSAKAQKVIQSFFEDIKESESLQQTVQKDLQLKKMTSFSKKPPKGVDSSSIVSVTKGYITQQMFTMGNLGNRFFTEVTNEDVEMEDSVEGDKKEGNELAVCSKGSTDLQSDKAQSDRASRDETNEKNSLFSTNEDIIPLRRVNIAIGFENTETQQSENPNTTINIKNFDEEEHDPLLSGLTDTESSTCSEEVLSPIEIPKRKNIYTKKPSTRPIHKQIEDLLREKTIEQLDPELLLQNMHYSSSNMSTESSDTHRMIIAKLHKKQSRKGEDEKSAEANTSSKGSSDKNYKKHKFRNINFEGYFIKKKNMKNKTKKSQRDDKSTKRASSFCDLSTSSKDDVRKGSKWKHLKKAKFKLEIEKTSESSVESEIEYSPSPERKKLKLELEKVKAIDKETQDTQMSCTESDIRTLENLKKQTEIEEKTIAQLLKSSETKTDDSGLSIFKKAIDSIERNESPLRRIHITSRDSSNRTFRASSAESKTSTSEKGEACKEEDGVAKTVREPLRREIRIVSNPLKNKSLTSLVVRRRNSSTERSHRIIIENINERIKSARETSELRKKNENPLKIEENYNFLNLKNFFRETTKIETSKKADNKPNFLGISLLRQITRGDLEQKDFQAKDKNEKKQEFKVGFFTTTSSQICDADLIKKTQLQEERGQSSFKRCDVEKYHFLDRELQEVQSPRATPDAEEVQQSENVQRSVSKKDLALARPNVKLDVGLPNIDTKELQTSVSYASVVKTPQSRSHSAESLNSMKKVYKRKGKKRPHCCKRNSKHYIRRNSSVFRKLNKVESKPLYFFGLTEEEQLKIISVNVAKYLKQKLLEHKFQFDPEKNFSFAEIEQVVLNDLKASEKERSREVETETDEKFVDESPRTRLLAITNGERTIDQVPVVEQTEVEKVNDKKTDVEEVTVASKESKESIKVEEVKSREGSSKQSKTPSPPRPVHNFIKLNKLMAGKYKRYASPAEKVKIEKGNKKDKQKENSSKTKTLKKKKEKSSSPKRVDPKNPNENPPEKASKGRKGNQSGKGPEKTGSGEKKPSPLDEPNQEVKSESTPKETPSSSLALQKIPPMRRPWVPAYMFTSYLPPPMEIIESKQREMNRYLLKTRKGKMGAYLPEVCYESTGAFKNEEYQEESLFTKDLEYLIKLQMCLNNEISENIENSMKYVRTLLGQDYEGAVVAEKPPVNEPLDFYEPCNKGVVLIEMSDILDYSSSGSDFAEEPGKRMLCTTDSSEGNIKPKLKSAELANVPPKDSGDSGIIDSFIREMESADDCNSDSSYNCEISITLNAPTGSEGEGEMQLYKQRSCSEESNTNQKESSVGQSPRGSVTPKRYRKKRKDNEISLEMKQKLLEILEGEIRREMAVNYSPSSETSSDALTLKMSEDSDGLNRSQSTESSSCDNLDLLTQISETMKQYLNDFKEKSRLSEINEKLQEDEDEEKDEDAS